MWEFLFKLFRKDELTCDELTFDEKKQLDEQLVKIKECPCGVFLVSEMAFLIVTPVRKKYTKEVFNKVQQILERIKQSRQMGDDYGWKLCPAGCHLGQIDGTKCETCQGRGVVPS